MADLITQSPFGSLLPHATGHCSLEARAPAAITSVTVQAGQQKAVSASLKKACGLTFPAANRATVSGETACVWVGPGQALLLGKRLKTLKGAALSDQSDGWAVMRLSGTDAEAVLARLVPVDLRVSVFARGFAAKTLLFHMPLSITRTGAAAFDLMVFRSMAATAVHEVQAAMESVAAQMEITQPRPDV